MTSSKDAVKTVTIASGLKIAYVEDGDVQKPLVLLIHGFPDTAYTWNSSMLQLAKAGFHAVAYFQRGYLPSDIPSDGDYSATRIGLDALELIPALGHKTAFTLVGHDWGALAAYSAAAMDVHKTTEDPNRSLTVERVITVAIPPPLALKPSLGFLWHGRHFIYMATPFAVSGTRANHFAYLDKLYHRWSPTWKVPEDELTQIKSDFSHEGRVEAAIGYYKAISNRTAADKNLSKVKLRAPLLVFGGLDDGVADETSFKRATLQCEDPAKCRVELVPKAGHWVHREQPEYFIKTLLDFLSPSAEQNAPEQQVATQM